MKDKEEKLKIEKITRLGIVGSIFLVAVAIFCENLVWDYERLRWDWLKPYLILTNQPKNSAMLPQPWITIPPNTFGAIFQTFQNLL